MGYELEASSGTLFGRFRAAIRDQIEFDLLLWPVEEDMDEEG